MQTYKKLNHYICCGLLSTMAPHTKPVEMAHFNQHFHTASGALVTGGMRSCLDAKIPMPTMAAQNRLAAKQLKSSSRPNNVEELRLKRRRRNKKLQEKRRKESRCVKQRLLKERIKNQVKIELETTSRSVMSQLRSRAKYYWRKWKEERSLRTTTSSV